MTLFVRRRFGVLLLSVGLVAGMAGVSCSSDTTTTNGSAGTDGSVGTDAADGEVSADQVPAGFFTTPLLDDVQPSVGTNDAPYRPGHIYFFRDEHGDLELSIYHDSGELAPLVADRTFDGRDFAFTDNRDDPYLISSVTVDLADGTRVFVSSLTLTVEQLVVIALTVEISADGDVSDIDGFTLAGSMPQARTRDGYTTTYELDNGASISVGVYTMSGDEALSWEFPPTEPVTVLGDTDAFMNQTVVRTLEVAFQYPDTEYFVRVTESPANIEEVVYTFGRDDIIDVIESLRLRAPTFDELDRD